MFKKVKDWYCSQSDSIKAMIWIGLIAVIGIIIRWPHIVDGATRGFNFYSGR